MAVRLSSYSVFFCLLFLLLASCGDKMLLGPSDYKAYINSHAGSLHTEDEVNHVKYDVKLQPPEYLTLVSSGDSIRSDVDFKKQLGYYSDKVNFILIISDGENSEHLVKKTILDGEKFGSVLSYANSSLSGDFMLVQDKDTLYTSLLHLEPANSMQPMVRITVGFKGIKKDAGELTLIYNDNIFNNGPLKFKYKGGALNDLPAVKI